jgi:hypothetical protein
MSFFAVRVGGGGGGDGMEWNLLITIIQLVVRVNCVLFVLEFRCCLCALQHGCGLWT